MSRCGHNSGSTRSQRLDAPRRSQITDDRRKNYRAWDAQQSSQEPVSPRDALPEDDLAVFLLDLIPQIDLTPFHWQSSLHRRKHIVEPVFGMIKSARGIR